MTKSAQVGQRNERELRTLSEAIDCLARGDLAKMGDISIQRFKALEAAIGDGQRALARHYEIIPPTEASSVTYLEKEHAAKLELRERQLRDRLLGNRPARNQKVG